MDALANAMIPIAQEQLKERVPVTSQQTLIQREILDSALFASPEKPTLFSPFRFAFLSLISK
jgi:hypothetical protein